MSFVLSGDLKADTRDFSRDVLDAHKKLEGLEKELDKTERKAKQYGKTTAVQARQIQKLRQAIHEKRSNLTQATRAFERGKTSVKKLTSELKRTDRATNSLNNRIKDSNARLADFAARATSASRVSGIFRNIGMSAKQLGQSLIPVSLGIIGLGVAAIKSSDNVFQLRNKLKASTGSMGKANKVLNQYIQLSRSSVGVTVDFATEIDAMFRPMKGVSEQTLPKLIQAIGKLKTALPELSAQGFGLNLSQLFDQGFELADMKQLANIPNLINILNEQFGGKGGVKGLQDVLKNMKAQGKLTIDSFLLGIAEAVNNNKNFASLQDSFLTKLQKELLPAQIAFAPLGDSIIEALKPLLEAAVPIIERLGKAFESLSPVAKQVTLLFTTIAAAAAPALIAFGAIATGIGGLISAGSAIAGAVAAIGGLTAVLPIVAGVGVALGVMATAAATLYATWQTNFGGIRDITKEVAEAIKSVWNTALSEIAKLTKDLTNQVAEFWRTNGDDIKAALDVIANHIQAVWKGIKRFWSENGEAIKAATAKVWSSIKTLVSEGLNVILNLVKLASAVLNGDWSSAWEAIKNLFMAGVRAQIAIIKGSGVLLATALQSAFNTMLSIASGVIGRMHQVGSDIVQGLISGISSRIPDVKSVMGTLMKASVIGQAMSLLQERSPSKVFMSIGENIVEGLIIGIKNKTGKAKEEMANFFRGLVGVAEQIGLIKDSTPLEKFKAALADPTAAKQIEAFAKSIGKTVDELRAFVAEKERINALTGSLESLAKAMKSVSEMPQGLGRGTSILGTGTSIATAPTTGTQPPDAPILLMPPPVLPEWDTFFGHIRRHFERLKETAQSTKEVLANAFIDFTTSIGDIFADAAANWDGTLKGFFQSILSSLRQVVSQILAELTRVMIMKAIVGIGSALAGALGGSLGGVPGVSGTHGGGGAGGSLGHIGGHADGGLIRGAGTSTSDSILARLSNNEYVIPADKVKKFGVRFFDAIRTGMPAFATGGLVTPQGAVMGGSGSSSVTTNHNYGGLNVNINLPPGSNPASRQTQTQIKNELARTLQQLQQTNFK